jgi:thioredoxin-related protein
MKKVFSILLLVVATLLIYSFVIRPQQQAPSGELAGWYSWEEAVAANQKNKKKIIVDVYTDWCGWCKRMDQTTFEDPEIKAYINEYFHPVKLDAEQKEDINYDGHLFKFKPYGRRGAHELALQLLNGRMSYPSIVYLNEDFEVITVSPGYKTPEQIIKELKYVAEEHYTSQTWKEYSANSGQ